MSTKESLYTFSQKTRLFNFASICIVTLGINVLQSENEWFTLRVISWIGDVQFNSCGGIKLIQEPKLICFHALVQAEWDIFWSLRVKSFPRATFCPRVVCCSCLSYIDFPLTNNFTQKCCVSRKPVNVFQFLIKFDKQISSLASGLKCVWELFYYQSIRFRISLKKFGVFTRARVLLLKEKKEKVEEKAIIRKPFSAKMPKISLKNVELHYL